MKYLLALLAFILVSIPVLPVSASQNDSGYIVQDPVLIKLKDGATLSAIIVRKQGVETPLPATLFFTTYYQGPGDIYFAKAPAERGYVGVVVYSRGIRTNLKDYIPYVHDGEDASEVIEWIAHQRWCNGKVGMFSGSYTGFVQWAVAKDPPAALKTIVPQVAVMPGFDTPMENNVFQSFAFRWANDILGYPPLPADLYGKWYQSGAPYRTLDTLAGYPNRIFQQWLEHPAYGHYWQSPVPTPQEYANLKIPVLVTDGYYDGSQIASMQYVRQYFKYNKNPDLYLVIGPYDHFGAQRRPDPVLMGYHIDPAANVNMMDLVFNWLDYVLKGGKKPAILKNRINYEVMGTNEWRHVASLDAMHDHTLKFYLHDSRTGSVHLLGKRVPADADYLTQTVDFRERSTQNNYFTPFIILDKLDSFHGLVFATEPFARAFDISGSFGGTLNIAINKRDVDLSLAFYQQMPDGKYFYLAHYLGRASYAGHREHRELLMPGVETAIPLADTNVVVRRISKGSRLVVVVNVNKNPYAEINYGTGKPVADESVKDAGDPLRVKWYKSSFITVPVQGRGSR